MKEKKKSRKIWLIVPAGILLAAVLAFTFSDRLEGEKPAVVLGLESGYLSASQKFSISVSDEKTGLRKVWVGLVKDGKEVVLLDKELPGTGLGGGRVKKETFELNIEPRKLGLADGKVTLRMMARDFSWRGWWNGNRTYIEKALTIDTRPPVLDVLTRVHNVSQGGTGLVIFRLSEPCSSKGVYVGEKFFPGYSGRFKDPNIVMTFFALDYTQPPGTAVYIDAADFAGNRVRAGFPHYLKPKAFKKDSIAISDNFLNWKMPEFEADLAPDSTGSMQEKFLKVNRDLRRANYREITGYTAKTATELFWSGAFLRLPNSARKSSFADHRKYSYKGPVIDSQVHLGIDLASVAHSPIPASNSGVVVFTGAIGIYGKTIIIDHGFGLFSLYSHLSSIEVNEGQSVAKGEIIGRTGSTGLAGGDHLHFSVMVHDTFVNPVEWWDAAWIRNNITNKIDAVRTLH